MANKEPIVEIFLKSGIKITIEEDLDEINVGYTYMFFNKVISRLKSLATGNETNSGYFTYDDTFVLIAEIVAIRYSEEFLARVEITQPALQLNKDATMNMEDIKITKYKPITIEFQ